MQIAKIIHNHQAVAHITAETVIITDAQSALDLIMTVKHETGIKNIVFAQDLITPDFFVLSNGLAGEILQKFVNYQFRLAIYGDYTQYTSKPLKDFIYESNHGQDIFFVDSLATAVQYLTEK